MAGPLRPRWVMRNFSRNVLRTVLGFALALPDGGVAGMLTMTSAERPVRSHQLVASSGLKTRGTSAGRGSTISRLN